MSLLGPARSRRRSAAWLLFSLPALLCAQHSAQQPASDPGWPCTGKPRAVDPVYVQTAEATGGQVFLFDRSEIQGFTLLSTGHAKHPVTIARATGTVTNYVDIPVPVDPSIESLFVSVSLQCKQRVVLYDPKSQDVRPDQVGGKDNVFLAGRISTIPKPDPGVWTIRLLGSGLYFAVVEAQTPVGVNRVEFEGGQPRAGTAQRITVQAGPIPGIQFRLVDAADQTIQPLPLEASPGTPNRYIGRAVLPARGFRVLAEGTDAQGYPVQRLDPHLYEAKP